MSYQLHCPNCNNVIAPENINVQKTIAACGECGAVFNFGDQVPSTRKVKRRKTKKPEHIVQTETADSLKLEMPLMQHTGYKLLMIFAPIFLLILYAAIMGDILGDADVDMVSDAILLSVLFLPGAVAMLSSLFMKQSIEVNTDELKHMVRLGSVPIYKRAKDVNDIVDVHVEEMSATRESVAQARYNLYAETYDGRQDMFMQNQPEETATYAQQVLSNFLQADGDQSRLLIQDEDAETDYSSYIEDEESLNQQENM